MSCGDRKLPRRYSAKTSQRRFANTITLARTGADNVSFTSLGNVTAVPGQMSQVDVDNSSIAAVDSKNLTVSIGAGGNARVCDPNVSDVNDSRYCV